MTPNSDRNTSPPNPLVQKTAAEAVGTFALVFAGCGAVMVNEISGGALASVGVAAVFGLIIMVMIYSVGHISGAHFNPAVTIAFAATGRMQRNEALPYIAGQVAAALLAAVALRVIFGPVGSLGATLPSGVAMQSFTLEAILTFLLMFVIASVATDARAVGELAGVAIGGTVALEALLGGPISGASMNPARSLGPALVSGSIQHLWIYLTAPILGAVAGAKTYELIRCGGPEARQSVGCC